ncbi:hypothetical protein B0H67DRAFT_601927 [Lasiosphaeris hirsuta]|uniref:Uncharacterized protein n=1 Tax=Lasiosphaeris hirsuta TaxID=260670 RepID=A0AA40A871_9PEZI|nr:hypothetical protein B0H67DRAFT_601927 [Lasiosphaeris hirsuta]
MGQSKVVGVAAEALSTAVDGTAAAAASLTSKSSALTTSRPDSVGESEPLKRGARLPDPVRFGLIVILSLSISSYGRSFLQVWTQGELHSIAKRPETYLLTVWKIFSLALGWFREYDGYDLAALALLSHGPATYLRSVFYGLGSLTAGAYLAVDIVSACLPVLLLRKLSDAHSAAPGIQNREIVLDKSIQVLTSALSGLIYCVVLFLASKTFLPSTFVLYFDGIPTIEPASEMMFLGINNPMTQLLSLLFGIAARTFIFTPLVTTPQQEVPEFDPADATLGQTVAWNLWGYTAKTKVSISRTAVVALSTAVTTYLQCAEEIHGVEPYGALVYASVWVTAAVVTGLSLRYIGSV